MHDLKEDILLRQFVPILRRFDMVQVEKLRKIGKNPKNFRKNHVFEANIIAQAENFRNLLTWPERAFTCGSFFEILNCLGEIGLEKNSRNFYKCRGMSRFGEKKDIGATACRAWARAETFNGLQKVLQILCVPGLTTL